jgi:hypothetical protein
MCKAKGRLIYSAEYDKDSRTVKTRDWRKKDEKEVSSNSGR